MHPEGKESKLKVYCSSSGHIPLAFFLVFLLPELLHTFKKRKMTCSKMNISVQFGFFSEALILDLDALWIGNQLNQ